MYLFKVINVLKVCDKIETHWVRHLRHYNLDYNWNARVRQEWEAKILNIKSGVCNVSRKSSFSDHPRIFMGIKKDNLQRTLLWMDQSSEGIQVNGPQLHYHVNSSNNISSIYQINFKDFHSQYQKIFGTGEKTVPTELHPGPNNWN
jgi:hypothetical protein